jgi:methionyl-tRNA formyltransferase
MPCPRIAVLSTDTTHHRYFLNRLKSAGVPIGLVLFETTGVVPPFAVGPLFEAEQDLFERARWQDDLELTNFDVFSVDNINEATRRLADWRPDLGLVFGTRRLTDPLLQLVPRGLINVHRGISQHYRGLDSELWAAYHRDWLNIGVTLHMVDSELDTGDVMAQESMKLAPGVRLSHLRGLATELATRLMIDVLTQLPASLPAGAPQLQRGRYYSFMPLELRRVVQADFNRRWQR